MHRLFVALRPPPAVRTMLLDLMEGVPGARWQDDEQLHVTLRFIGEVDGAVAEDVAAALSAIDHPAPVASIAGVGRFERKGATDTLWAGLAPADPLRALHRKVDHAVARAGLAHEGRSYLPHVTLARFARRSGADTGPFLAANAGLVSPPFAMAHMILFESRLARDGASYHVVERYPLAR